MPTVQGEAGRCQRGLRLFLPSNLAPSFGLIGRLKGPGGAYLRWIESRTGCTVSVHVPRSVKGEVLPAHLLVVPVSEEEEEKKEEGKGEGKPQLARAVRLCRSLIVSTLKDYKRCLTEKKGVDAPEKKNKDQLTMSQEVYKGFKEWYFKQSKDVQIRLWNQYFKQPL